MFAKDIKIRSNNQIKSSEKEIFEYNLFYRYFDIVIIQLCSFSQAKLLACTCLFRIKNLIKEILKQYPSVDENELKNIIKVKDSEILLTKIITHDSTDMVVYFVDKVPYFFKFDKDDQLLPSVYFLWKFPNILPKFYTHREVFGKLVNGAVIHFFKEKLKKNKNSLKSIFSLAIFILKSIHVKYRGRSTTGKYSVCKIYEHAKTFKA
ncbi:eukaryotic translation initiation factor 2D [Brachionus plicatilis]|uniref:Eukaryotic translation initiation factor 2D n=1 Tax=Brachionus plicatilis TaxID=10195 RepID=A0A3M7TAC2_BRAPC|nr:eukaryotic translation initiation factor 2D [Brachionus plicatilis]